MDIRQLKSFVHVAEARNYTRAASILHLSQPALSRQMRMLEEELRTTLFHRHGHGVTLTPDGVVLFEKAHVLLAELENLRSTFIKRGPGITGGVAVGVPQGVSPFLAHPFLANCRKYHPNISLHLVEGYSGLLHEWLLSGSIDIAVLYGTADSKTIMRRRVLIEDLYAIGAATQANAARESFTAAELNDQPLILPRPPHAIREATLAAGIRGSSVIEVDALAVMLELAALQQGYTILPRTAVLRDLQAKSVVAIPICQPTLSWPVSICYSSLKPLSDAESAIVDMIAEQLVEFVKSGRWIARLC
jgi:LysR family nitrogen assimilation transcriptional regulator